MNIKKISGGIIFDILNTVLLLLLAFITLYPFVYVAAASLSDGQYIIRGEVTIWPKGLTLDAYKRVIQFDQIWISYKNTILYTSVGTAVNIIMTALTAYPLSKKKLSGRKFFSLLILITMLFDAGMIPKFLVIKQLGLYNTFFVMVIPTAISAWNLFVMKTFFEQIPNDLEEAATIDGCNVLGILIKIVIPLSKASLLTIGLFYAVSHWNSFFNALIYLQDSEKYPLQIMLRQIVMISQIENEFLEGEKVFTDNIKYAVIMVATIPILCVYPFIQKHFVKGVMIGALKG